MGSCMAARAHPEQDGEDWNECSAGGGRQVGEDGADSQHQRDGADTVTLHLDGTQRQLRDDKQQKVSLRNTHWLAAFLC